MSLSRLVLSATMLVTAGLFVALGGCVSESREGSMGMVAQPVLVGQNLQTRAVSVTTESRDDWTQVTFETPFAEPPYLFVGPPTHNGADPTTVRARNVTATGFEVQLLEWDYLDGSHKTEEVTYLAMGASHLTLGGFEYAAGSLQVTHEWTAMPAAVPDPFVFATQVTDHGPAATVIRARKLANGDFEFRLQEQEANANSHKQETIHVIQAQGHSPSHYEDFTISVGRTFLDHNWKPTNGSLLFMQSYEGGNTAAIRITDDDRAHVEEEQSKDSEGEHCNESVGYIRVEAAAGAGGF